MKKILITCTVIYFILSVTVLAQENMKGYGSCSLCGMRLDDSRNRMLIEYDDGTKLDMCSMHCTAAEFAAHREKTLKRLWVSDYNSNKLIDAKKAYWVIGGNKSGVMTKRAKWAFEKREEAEQFIRDNGGQIATFDEAMKATFEDMYTGIRITHKKSAATDITMADMENLPECIYCGMSRHQYAYSRALVIYDDGTAVGTCSIHCAAIDLTVNMNKPVNSVMIADYSTRKLIDAEKAVWVIGGEKSGVMTKRAKWAFEKREEAEQFIKDNGGQISTLDEVMKTTFEDMYEILR
jgi:copper chaperone NosL